VLTVGARDQFSAAARFGARLVSDRARAGALCALLARGICMPSCKAQARAIYCAPAFEERNEMLDLLITGGDGRGCDHDCPHGRRSGGRKNHRALCSERRAPAGRSRYRRSRLPCFTGGIDPHCHYNMRFGSVTTESQQYSPAAACGGAIPQSSISFFKSPRHRFSRLWRARSVKLPVPWRVDYAFHAILGWPDFLRHDRRNRGR